MKRAGTLLLFLFLPAAAAAEEPAAASAGPRLLVVCMDGVGYDLVIEMHKKGELKNFLPPQPLITTFPSDTNLGLAEMLEPLGAPLVRGYEDYYFDPAKNRLRGGVFHRLSRKHFIEGTFRTRFDYHPHPIRMTLEYGLPLAGPWLNGALSLARLKAEFKKSSQPVFFAYFEASDLAAHINGDWLVRQQVRALDRLVGKLRSDPAHPVEVVVFSDHGNDPRRMRRADLEEALERAGFRLGGKLKDERSVILPQFGLISNAVLYTAPGAEAAVGWWPSRPASSSAWKMATTAAACCSISSRHSWPRTGTSAAARAAVSCWPPTRACFSPTRVLLRGRICCRESSQPAAPGMKPSPGCSWQR